MLRVDDGLGSVAGVGLSSSALKLAWPSVSFRSGLEDLLSDWRMLLLLLVDASLITLAADIGGGADTVCFVITRAVSGNSSCLALFRELGLAWCDIWTAVPRDSNDSSTGGPAAGLKLRTLRSGSGGLG